MNQDICMPMFPDSYDTDPITSADIDLTDTVPDPFAGHIYFVDRALSVNPEIIGYMVGAVFYSRPFTKLLLRIDDLISAYSLATT